MKSAKEVKEIVAYDLKQRHYTRKKASETIGFTRQAFYNLMNRDGYFTEKQAILFSLAFGYNKEFLMTGKGTLVSADSDSDVVAKEIIQYQNRVLELYRKTNEANSLLLSVLNVSMVEDDSKLLEKTKALNDLLKTFELSISVTKSDDKLGLLASTEELFAPLYNDIVTKIDRGDFY